MKEQILALAVQSGFKLDWAILNCTGQFESFYHAAIESYKAELLKEVGEPVAYYDPDLDCGSAGISFDPLSDGIGLYTSDQVAAAIAKATKPLEEEIERLFKSGEKLLEEKHKAHKSEREVWDQLNELRTQLTKTEQLWQVAQGRCDGLEEKLAKAEQRVAEWQPIETAPKDGTVFLGYKLGQFRECYKVPRDDCDMWCFGGVSGADDLFPNIKPTHWMPLPTPPKRSMEGV